MFKRIAVTLLALFVMFGMITMAAAQDDGLVPVDSENYGTIARFNDGRLNAFDIAAPVAVYYSYDRVPAYTGGPNLDVLRSVQVWAYNPDLGTSQKVVDAPIATLLADEPNLVDDPFVVGGIALHHTDNGYFTLQAPNADGTTYTFSWYDRK
jgi:hypothetical protein